MNARDLEQRIREHITMFNGREWDRYKADLSASCILEEEATQRKINGPEKIVEAMKEWVAAFPDLKGTVRDVFVAGDKGVCEISWVGTHKGTLTLTQGTLPATGRRAEVHSMDKIEIDQNGKIRAMVTYFDLGALLGQLGAKPQISPQPGARP